MNKLFGTYSSLVIFIFFSTFYLLTSIYIGFYLRIYHNDAIARTALAFFTIFGRNPHLSSIGFVWTPLPSLIQIPLIFLLKPLNLHTLSGSMVTSFTGALTVVVVYKILLLLSKGIKKRYYCLIAVLYGFNPLILLYSSNGASEIIFLCLLSLSTYCLLRWLKEGDYLNISLSSFFVSAAFLARYEAVPFFLTTLFTLIVFKFPRKKATVYLYGLPFIYIVFIWILANWLIMNDPLYFIRSPYSNPAFTHSLKSSIASTEFSYLSVSNSILYVAKRVALITPSLILLPIIFWKNTRSNLLKDFNYLLIISLPYLSILFFHIYQLYTGDSFGWLRFYISSIILASFILIYFISYKYWKLTLVCIFLSSTSIFTTIYALNTYSYGKEEMSFINKMKDPLNYDPGFSRTYLDQIRVANFMDTTSGNILLDTNAGFAIPIFSRRPERFYITQDIDYTNVVKNYTRYVDWIIIPKPSPSYNKIYELYPEIWNGDKNLKLYKQLDDWKIFKVITAQKND